MTRDSLQLTEEEAEKFLELLDKVETDMSTGFEAAAARTFGDDSAVSSDGEAILDEWDDDVGALYTTVSRHKIRRFVEETYLEEEREN